MSIWSSLYTSTSGISAYGNAMGVVGDNVANVGTTGFKGSRAGFAALLGGIGANQQRVGAGVVMSGAEVGFGQGSLQQTGRNLDMAVWGEGWFVLDGNHKGVDGQYFTRDGRFAIDQEGFLVNTGGLRLQGYQFDEVTGRHSSLLGDINVPDSVPPSPTTELGMRLQLDPPTGNQNATNPTGEPDYSPSVTIYDDLGRARQVTFEFTYDHQQSVWNWEAKIDGSELANGVPDVKTVIGNGQIGFAADGTLNFEDGGAINPHFAGTAAAQVIVPDFAGSTQHAGSQDIRVTQNGYGAGVAEDFQVNEEGIIEAIYSNKERRPVGRVALATFKGEANLERTGSQLFRETPDSGNPSIGNAASSSRGAIRSGTLEGSNVDLGTELVTMITYQRAFQANARAVSTADEMLAETANIKR